ncbi:hypothetical protein [Pelotomaculum propionicicum]|uniref:DUF927 domain-containing protein n=1 Tax=Pelotomaculum propionicicum TaxID=258475 RepID=A0A4Y7RWL7_9FIRM|nr:hypothetical protein [Pelotomaculum propionicicum]TEB13398.1 hypothetical protein Pmgp_00292 [Pelotomaculum propionicicum]
MYLPMLMLHDKYVNHLDIIDKIKESVGGYQAYVAAGWVVATILSNPIFEEFKCFPILFVHGKRESGKSTFMRWIMNFFGIETEGIGLAETSQNFIARALSYYSSLGVWFDEYRNEPKVTAKDGFFRSAYNRQYAGKGTTTAFQTRGFDVSGTIAISGEELPRDNGLFTRCVILQMSAYKRSREHYDWLNQNSHTFSGLTYYVIMEWFYDDRKVQMVIKNIKDLKAVLIKKGISDRTAENWAICAGAFDAVIKQDDDFIRWVEKACQEIKLSSEQEHMLNQFWEDLGYLISKNELNSKHFYVGRDPKYGIDSDLLYIWFPAVYTEWALHYRKKTGREPFNKVSILKNIREEPYFVDNNALKRFGNDVRKALVINLSEATDEIREIAENFAEVAGN